MRTKIALGALVLLGVAVVGVASTLVGPWRMSELADGEKLLLFERLPVGSPFAEALRLVPDLEYVHRFRAYRAATSLFDREAELTVSEAGDTVRAWHYRLPTSSKAEGDSLMRVAAEFYAAYFGPPAAEEGADHNQYEEYRGWCWPGMNLAVVHYSDGAGPSAVTVGIQSRCAHQLPFELLKGPRVWPYTQ